MEKDTPDFFKQRDLFGFEQSETKVEINDQNQIDAPPDLNVVYATLGSRILAYFLDIIIILIPSILIDLILFGPNFYEPNNSFGLNLVHLIIWTLYYGFTESSEQQATYGKRICKLKVIDEYGKRLSFKKASFRFLTQIISIVPLGFGIWSIATDKKKQAWHDMLLGCYVIDRKENKLKTRDNNGEHP